MYEVSEAFKTAIKSRSRMIEWWGTITLTTGEVYSFANADIVQGTGTITRSCSSQSSIDLGGVYAGELQISLRMDIDRYKLIDARIEIYSRVNYFEPIVTWGNALPHIWSEMSQMKWGDNPKEVHADIPMGIFIVSEALRAVNSIKITAYDYMLNFDKTLPTMDKTARSPFEWLRWMCKQCNVELADNLSKIKVLSNGVRSLTYAEVNNEISTYRDLLSQLATVLCSVATINRAGKLTLLQYGMNAVDSIDSAFRYTSDFSEYQTYYTGMYASYRSKAVQEYFRNGTVVEDTGLTMDIGYNVFLQISNDGNRKSAVQAIINNLKNNKYSPFNVTMPFNPAYDLMDVLTFTDNQTTNLDIAPITSITFKVNDSMTVLCAGENPKLITAQSRESKAVEGLNDGTNVSGTSYASGDFWIQIDSYPDGNEAVDIAVNTETDTTQIKFTTTVENTRTQIVWTGCYTLDEDATVKAMVYADDEKIYEIADEQTAGIHSLTVSTGHEFNAKGDHIVKIRIKEVLS